MLRLISAWFDLVRLGSTWFTNHRSPTIAHQPSLSNHRSAQVVNSEKCPRAVVPSCSRVVVPSCVRQVVPSCSRALVRSSSRAFVRS